MKASTWLPAGMVAAWGIAIGACGVEFTGTFDPVDAGAPSEDGGEPPVDDSGRPAHGGGGAGDATHPDAHSPVLGEDAGDDATAPEPDAVAPHDAAHSDAAPTHDAAP